MVIAGETTMSPRRSTRTLTVVLIKPSRYDDDGYVVRHWRGVLPSNTLAAIYSLTEQVSASGELGPDVALRLGAYDETVHRVDPAEVIRRYGPRLPSDLTLIALVAVQTNQWPRAADLALEFRRRGLPVLVGGFHVSGVLEQIGR